MKKEVEKVLKALLVEEKENDDMQGKFITKLVNDYIKERAKELGYEI